MTKGLLYASLCVAALAIGAAPAAAQHRAGGAAVGHVAPRAAVVGPRVIGPRFGGPFRSGFFPFRPVVGFGFYGGYPYPYGYYGYPYPYYGAYGYGPYGYPAGYMTAGYAYGGVRIQGAARDAQVFVDGYYVGVVDNFDGPTQHLNLEPGPHKVEIRAGNAQPIAFDVNVRPGDTVTYRAGR